VISDAAAVILAGGSARRMGGERKGLLEIGGRAIIDWQLEVLQEAFAEIFVVSSEGEPFPGRRLSVVPDLLPGRGAPGGVYTALEAAASEWVFCVGCDMPFLRREAIALLAARRAGHDVVLAARGECVEPLVAFYSRRCREPLREALSQGVPSLGKLIQGLSASVVDARTLAKVDPGCLSLENVNTPHDLVRARALVLEERRAAG